VPATEEIWNQIFSAATIDLKIVAIWNGGHLLILTSMVHHHTMPYVFANYYKKTHAAFMTERFKSSVMVGNASNICLQMLIEMAVALKLGISTINSLPVGPAWVVSGVNEPGKYIVLGDGHTRDNKNR